MIFPRPEITYPRMVFHEIDLINLDESLYVPEMDIPELIQRLPKSKVWTWETEPETRAGDMFAFRWGATHQVLDGQHHRIEYPDVFIEFTRHPIRHTSMRYWWAPFELHGINRTEYMAPGGATSPRGATTNPLRAIDDAPLEEVEKSRDQLLDEARTRSTKRQDARRDPNRDSRSTVPSAGSRTIPN